MSFAVRFEGTASETTAIKFMTDGVLAKEIEADIEKEDGAAAAVAAKLEGGGVLTCSHRNTVGLAHFAQGAAKPQTPNPKLALLFRNC